MESISILSLSLKRLLLYLTSALVELYTQSLTLLDVLRMCPGVQMHASWRSSALLLLTLETDHDKLL
jgi:hypothetical protein